MGALAAQPTGMRVSDGSWHYAALTYSDDTATVDLAEAAAVTLPDKLLGDAMYVFGGAGVPDGEVGAGDWHWAAVDSNTARRGRWMAS
jgi:hypothetical protein